MVTPDTAVSGIKSVPPSQFCIFDSSGEQVLTENYWSASRDQHAAPIDETQLARVLEQSVDLHLASDVPLGIFLSGGVNSAAVANLAKKATRTPIHTFTMAFEEKELQRGRDRSANRRRTRNATSRDCTNGAAFRCGSGWSAE